MEETDFRQLLREGITAARAGQKERARNLLLQVIEQNERSEPAWLWLSGIIDDPEERRICLENVLAINPHNAAAQAGLRFLNGSVQPSEKALRQEPATYTPPEPPAPQPPAPAPTPHLQPDLQAVQAPVLSTQKRSAPTVIEFDPFGCPYCGGSVSGDEPRCDNCNRLVELRYRRRSNGQWLGWLAMFVVLQGVVGVGEAYLASRLAEIGQLPAWLNESPIKFLIGPAFRLASIEPNLDRLGQTLVSMNAALTMVCVALALGIVLRNRAAYFASLFAVGLLAVTAVVGLVVGFSGPLPGLIRLALIAFCFRWLMEVAPTFEWMTRRYSPDLDPDLQTDLDYYDQGSRYWDMGMWAKAAAHWQVATRLAPTKVEYRTVLAKAYVKLDYMAAALAEADKALAQAPEDNQLRTFRDSLAELALRA